MIVDNNAACTVGYYVIGVCSYIFEELVDIRSSVFGSSSLFGTNFNEDDEQVVIGCAVIVEEITYDSFDTFDACFGKGGSGSWLFGVLDFGDVGHFGVFVGRYLRLFGGRVIVFGEDIGDVVVNFEATGMFRVIPVKVNSDKAGSVPVLRYLIMFLGDAL